MTAPLSADQQARLAAIEAAPEAEEAIRERLAMAIHDAWATHAGELMGIQLWRVMADAALAVLRGPSVADEALRRVEELADEYDGIWRESKDTDPTDVIIAATFRASANDIRAALNGGDR